MNGNISQSVTITANAAPESRVLAFGPFRRGSLVSRATCLLSSAGGNTQVTFTLRSFDTLPNAAQSFVDGMREFDAFTIVLGKAADPFFEQFDLPLYSPVYDKRYFGLLVELPVVPSDTFVTCFLTVLPPQNQKRVT